MIVVHPSDPSTRMLWTIYEDLADVRLFDSYRQREDILSAIASSPRDEPIILLGHGSPNGLLDRRYGTIIGDEDAPLLKDRPNLVGIWCYASTFAHRHGLMGFFSGMFISELYEAWDSDIEASEDEVDFCASDFALRFGDLLRAGKSVKDAAMDLMDPRHMDSPLTEFNYSRLQYRDDGTGPRPKDMDDPSLLVL